MFSKICPYDCRPQSLNFFASNSEMYFCAQYFQHIFTYNKIFNNSFFIFQTSQALKQHIILQIYMTFFHASDHAIGRYCWTAQLHHKIDRCSQSGEKSKPKNNACSLYLVLYSPCHLVKRWKFDIKIYFPITGKMSK